MLGKMIKYDIQSTWRRFAAVYLSILLGVLIVPFILNNVDNRFVNMIAVSIAVGIVIATAVVMVSNLFRIYSVNIFSKQGYLTMTLPVTSAQLVFSKLLVSSLWIALTGIVSIIAMFLYTTTTVPNAFGEISAAIQKIVPALGNQGVGAAVLLLLIIFMNIVKEISKLFLACSIAHLKELNRFRVPAGIASYFLFSYLEAFIVKLAGAATSQVPYFTTMTEKLNALSVSGAGLPEALGVFNGFIVIGIAYALILALAYSAGTVWFLNHKLDLD
jgi:hypothetical protein